MVSNKFVRQELPFVKLCWTGVFKLFFNKNKIASLQQDFISFAGYTSLTVSILTIRQLTVHQMATTEHMKLNQVNWNILPTWIRQ